VLRLPRQLHKAETYQTGEQGARAQVRVHGPADHVAGGFCSGQQSTELPGRRQRTLCSVIAFTASISSAHKAMLCRSANTSHWWGPISVISTPRQSVDPVATLTDCRDSFLADFVAGENGFVGGHSDSSGAKRTTAPAA
jgi:hypothetical protein